MEYTIISILILTAFIISVIFVGAKSEEALSATWLVQTRDKHTGRVTLSKITSKQIYESSKNINIKNTQYLSSSLKIVHPSIKELIVKERDEKIIMHPALKNKLAPISFHINKEKQTPQAVKDWIDLFSEIAEQEHIATHLLDGRLKLDYCNKMVTLLCPVCLKKIKVPSEKNITITCPNCEMKFDAQT